MQVGIQIVRTMPPEFIKSISQITNTIIKFSIKHFKALDALFFCGYGTKEVLFDGFAITGKKSKVQSEKIDSEIERIKSFLKDHHVVNGILYSSIGLSEALCAFDQYKILSLGSAVTFFSIFGGGIFLLTNILGLDNHVKLFIHANKLASKVPTNLLAVVNRIKISSLMGIISNLGYIIATTLALFGAPVMMALVLGCLAVCIGGVKTFFDLFLLKI